MLMCSTDKLYESVKKPDAATAQIRRLKEFRSISPRRRARSFRGQSQRERELGKGELEKTEVASLLCALAPSRLPHSDPGILDDGWA